MKLVAVIPVKHSSERVNSKNFREFFEDQSLLEIKIIQLLQSKVFDEIYISSDSSEAEKMAKEYKVKFLKRDVSLCNNITAWSEVIYEVIKSLPENDNVHVAWCHTTSPIFSNFKDATNKYLELCKEEDYNGLIAVSKCNEFILDESATPINYSWGPWHKYSQHLKKYFFVSGALFIASKHEMLKNRYVISSNPYLYQTTDAESVDIDTESDYEYAQYLYKKLFSK